MFSGIIEKNSLRNLGLIEYFEELQREQESWLQRYSDKRGSDYKWPKNALKNWSRFIEYPYFWTAILSVPELANKTILDIGPGVTFFSCLLASKCKKLVSVDIDPTVVNESNKMMEEMGYSNAKCFLTSEGLHDTVEYDIVTCLSVLEHTHDPVAEFQKITNLVRRGGHVIISFDINENENRKDGLSANEFNQIQEIIRLNFNYVYPLQVPTKKSILSNENSKFPMYGGFFYNMKESFYKQVGRKSNSVKLSCFIAMIQRM